MLRGSRINRRCRRTRSVWYVGGRLLRHCHEQLPKLLWWGSDRSRAASATTTLRRFRGQSLGWPTPATTTTAAAAAAATTTAESASATRHAHVANVNRRRCRLYHVAGVARCPTADAATATTTAKQIAATVGSPTAAANARPICPAPPFRHESRQFRYKQIKAQLFNQSCVGHTTSN